ncbi:hypothetical protein [Schaalia hyovaginalis]|uniref:Uncharacterized protein n=1 Tax=Schaalia hyovaginalis TaxID=29316 RepID=A0A923E093_9ACTO|nr:hypothetical protein [Schaalia hyovaginalis]MBB6333519.1 hypothetical protein [Schaalia hyovaginalis]
MDLSIGTGTTKAAIQLQGAMTTAIFEAGTEREFSPTYVATWKGFPEAPILDRLRGDFLCVPFGAAPASAEELPEGWREGHDGESPWIHGPSSNLEWTPIVVAEDSATLSLTYPDDSPIAGLERTVTCREGAVEFFDRIHVRRDCRLPLGLHPILSLPTEPGAAALETPEAGAFWVLPLDSGTSVLEVGAVFDDLGAAPRADGSTIDLTRLPLTVDVDEIVLIAGPKEPRIALVNRADGYRVAVEWDPELLGNAMLWISNRGRSAEPWGGTNLCLGVEPITSAFDFGEGVSAADNPLTRADYATAVDLEGGRTYEIRHRLVAERID